MFTCVQYVLVEGVTASVCSIIGLVCVFSLCLRICAPAACVQVAVQCLKASLIEAGAVHTHTRALT